MILRRGTIVQYMIEDVVNMTLYYIKISIAIQYSDQKIEEKSSREIMNEKTQTCEIPRISSTRIR